MLKHSSSPFLPKRLVALALAGCLAACGGGGGGDAGAGGGGGDGDGDGGGGDPGGGVVTISGRALYEFPPPAAGCQGLAFDAVEARPIRQATIQLLDAATDAVLDSGVTADTGDFSLAADPGTEVYIRVRAELKRSGGPAWDVEVRDNTTTETETGEALALEDRPLYVLDTAPFDSGDADIARDVTAATGWNDSTSSYTGARAAAPFAVLDVAYASMQLVLAEEPTIAFEPLDIFWSINNRPTDTRDLDLGEIGTSFYSSANRLFLLGASPGDADEFDDHVVAHEWGHYFEDTFSRSDSIGGPHFLGDALDMRVAFGEGFATALSGMALDYPIYCDTESSGGFDINIEGEGRGTPGWFNEISVMKLVYDLWDTANDGADTGSLGFGPIYRVMTGEQAVTPAFTSIFSFATALKAENPLDSAFIDQLLQAEAIHGTDEYGAGETNDGQPPDPADVLPVYTRIVPDGTVVNICSNRQFDSDDPEFFTGNKLSQHRYLRMTVTDPSRYTFTIETTTDMPAADDPEHDSDQSDPDIWIQRQGVLQNAYLDLDDDGELESLEGFSGAAKKEIFTTQNPLAAGDYVMALVEFRYQDTEPPLTPDDYPGQTCFDVRVAPAAP